MFLFPSETETFGNVTLEAMASGLAVVAYDYAAARIHIAHGESGVLVPRGDAGAFIEGAAALARSPQCWSAMGRRARQHATSVGWQAVVEPFEALLARAVRGRPDSAMPAAIGREGVQRRESPSTDRSLPSGAPSGERAR